MSSAEYAIVAQAEKFQKSTGELTCSFLEGYMLQSPSQVWIVPPLTDLWHEAQAYIAKDGKLVVTSPDLALVQEEVLHHVKRYEIVARTQDILLRVDKTNLSYAAKVFDENNVYIGVVRSIQNRPLQPLLHVETDTGTVLLPYDEELVISNAPTSLVLKIPQGLLGDDDGSL